MFLAESGNHGPTPFIQAASLALSPETGGTGGGNPFSRGASIAGALTGAEMAAGSDPGAADL